MLPRVLLVALLFVASAITASESRTASCKKRAAKLCGPTSFSFYLQNTVYDTTVQNKVFNSVYGPLPNISFPNPFAFGVTSTFEDPITAGVSATSEQIGMARGIWQSNSFTEYVLFFLFTANITEGTYKGTIDIFGLIREVEPVRILSVIGGTGDFLAARGVAKNTLAMINNTAPGSFTLSFDLDLYY